MSISIIACMCLLSQVKGDQDVVVYTPTFPNEHFKKGTLLDDLVRTYPGYYVAYADPMVMPKIDQLAPEKRSTYSGLAYVINSFPGVPHGVVRLRYDEGKLAIAVNAPNGPQPAFSSIGKLLKWLPQNADVRYALNENGLFDLNLPKDIARLKHFQGELLRPSRSHNSNRGDSFWAGVKNGRLTYILDNMSH